MINQILPISALSDLIKTVVEDDEDLQDIWVDGEISNLSIANSGHAYFSLKDAQTQLRAVMWKSARSRQRIDLKPGNSVIAHGSITFYQARGELQLQVDVIQPKGTGALQLQYEQLRIQLESEGLFEPSRKRELPYLPAKIGVVTSASGAVWHDIQHVLSRRYPLADLVLSPSLVQGESAAPSIVAALDRLISEEAPDVIIIGRGGGSMEDLWAFNDERVVRAIFASSIPIVSAIGHETDTTLSDMAADRRAPTPSAAAEIVAPDLGEIDLALRDVQRRIGLRMLRRLNDTTQDLDQHALRMVALQQRHLAKQRDVVDGLESLLQSLNPAAVLERGYSITTNASGEIVRSSEHLTTGDDLTVQFARGKANVQVRESAS